MQGKEINFNRITKSLLNQDMDDILGHFFKLEDFLDRDDYYIREWLIIKLVTIIEQFCREIIKNRIDNNPDIQSHKKFNMDVTKLDHAKKISIGSLITSQYNFQNIKIIIDELKHYNIDYILNDEDKNDLDKLFKIRHDIIHTISSTQNYNIKKGYPIIRNLLKEILRKSTYGITFYQVSHGMHFGLLEKYDEAMNCFTDAIKINSNDIIAHYYIGITYCIINNPRKVYDCSVKIIDLNPEDHIGYYLQGHSFDLQKKYGDAIACYDKAIKMTSNFAPAYYDKYRILLKLNRNKEAEQCLKTAIRIDPDGDYPSISNDEKRM